MFTIFPQSNVPIVDPDWQTKSQQCRGGYDRSGKGTLRSHYMHIPIND